MSHADYTGIIIPEAYKAYAGSEAEALEIVAEIDKANPSGRFTGKIYNLPYSPSLWTVSLAIRELNA